MPFVTRKSLLTLSILSGIAVAAVAGFVWSGVYNVGADDYHTRPVYALMEALRERSIEVRASKLQVPALNDPVRIVQGAGNYNAMCTGCHLTPGADETELSKGLYPAPPNLTKTAVDAGEAFWVIKHGVKASGMPAWGMSMDDEYIWNMVAFLQELPKLNAQQYQALVDRSGGHSHGGGETDGHAHAEGMADDHDEAGAADHPHTAGQMDHHDPQAKPAAGMPSEAGTTHVHADGKRHVHAPTPAATKAAPSKPEASAQPMTEPAPVAEPEPSADEHNEHDHQH
ncbi:MAG TPA: cytochrome c [Lysobacter sp.]